jgi:hypothetical protein
MPRKTKARTKNFFIWYQQKHDGPLSVQQLREVGITRETLVWNSSLPDWTEAQNVEELKELFPHND